MNPESYYKQQLVIAKRNLATEKRRFKAVEEPRFASDIRSQLRAQVDRWEREVEKWQSRLDKIQEGV